MAGTGQLETPTRFEIRGTRPLGPVLQIPTLRRALMRGVVYGAGYSAVHVIYSLLAGEAESPTEALLALITCILTGAPLAVAALIEFRSERLGATGWKAGLSTALAVGLTALLFTLSTVYTQALWETGSMELAVAAAWRLTGTKELMGVLIGVLTMTLPLVSITLGRLRDDSVWRQFFGASGVLFVALALAMATVFSLLTWMGGGGLEVSSLLVLLPMLALGALALLVTCLLLVGSLLASIGLGDRLTRKLWRRPCSCIVLSDRRLEDRRDVNQRKKA